MMSRTRKTFFVATILVLFCSEPAYAATYYVRPFVTGGYGTKDGLSYANAFSGFAATPWGTMAVGDIVRACGSFGASSATPAVGNVMISVRSSGVTWDGDCSSDGDLARAIIDGQGQIARGADSSSGGSVGITLKNLEIKGFTAQGVMSQGDNVTARNWTLDNLYVHDNRGANTMAIWARGAGLTITNSHFLNCGNDCIYTEGDNLTATNLVIEYPGLDGPNNEGDGLQNSIRAHNWRIDNVVVRMQYDRKQCILIGPISSGDQDGTLSNSSCYGAIVNSLSHIAFAFGGAGNVTVYNNYAEKSRYLIYVTPFTHLTAYNNIVSQLNATTNAGIQCGANTGSCTFYNNSIHNSTYGIITASPGVGPVDIKNNAISTMSIAGIATNATNSTQSNNAVFNTPNAFTLALQLLFLRGSESMGNHDSKIVDAGSVD